MRKHTLNSYDRSSNARGRVCPGDRHGSGACHPAASSPGGDFRPVLVELCKHSLLRKHCLSRHLKVEQGEARRVFQTEGTIWQCALEQREGEARSGAGEMSVRPSKATEAILKRLVRRLLH